MKRPDVFTYTDYRLFLKDCAIHAQSRNPRWSYGLWARKMGLSSKSSLIMILNGQRNPGKPMVEKLCVSLALSDDEKRHFEKLVEISKKSADPMLRMMLLKAEQQRERGVSPDAGRGAGVRWLFMVLREATQIPGFREDLDWLNSGLPTPVSDADFRSALEALIAEGILRREKDRKLALRKDRSPAPWSWAEIVQFHQDGLDASARAMEQLPVEERVFQTSFLRVRRDRVEEARALIRGFQKEFGRLLEEADQDADSVFQLNLQFFPVAKPRR